MSSRSSSSHAATSIRSAAVAGDFLAAAAALAAGAGALRGAAAAGGDRAAGAGLAGVGRGAAAAAAVDRPDPSNLGLAAISPNMSSSAGACFTAAAGLTGGGACLTGGLTGGLTGICFAGGGASSDDDADGPLLAPAVRPARLAAISARRSAADFFGAGFASTFFASAAGLCGEASPHASSPSSPSSSSTAAGTLRASSDFFAPIRLFFAGGASLGSSDALGCSSPQLSSSPPQPPPPRLPPSSSDSFVALVALAYCGRGGGAPDRRQRRPQTQPKRPRSSSTAAPTTARAAGSRSAAFGSFGSDFKASSSFCSGFVPRALSSLSSSSWLPFGWV
mmetsp:Transcript_8268/g.27206  ORF Transcript_8268/g.27206 Transcript_8268/m.27206 type:complete len:335 (+) Transcript_8268:212-1216(+)